MKWNAAHRVSAVVVLALAATVAGQVHALCGPGQRTSHEDADCLSVDWNTSSIPSLYNLVPVTTQNLCPDIGAITTRINMETLSSHLPEAFSIVILNDGTPKVSYARSEIKGVYCCEDLGDKFCNQSDVTAESCLDRFGDSPASASCSNSSAAVNANYECVITADCITGGLNDETQPNNVAVRYGDVYFLSNCSGGLEVGGCDGLDAPLN